MKGRYGPYLKYGDKNISLPRGKDPLQVSLEDCVDIIVKDAGKSVENPLIREFKEADIQIINGRYGPYIKHAGANYKIPKDTDASTLSERDCQRLINNSKPTEKGRRRFKKS